MSCENKVWVDMLRDRIIPNMQSSSDLRQRFSSEIVALEIIADLLESTPLSDPAPLTLEQLRAMDGEPVYDWYGDSWLVIAEVNGTEIIMTDGSVFDWHEYDTPPKFYTHKQKDREVSECGISG